MVESSPGTLILVDAAIGGGGFHPYQLDTGSCGIVVPRNWR